MRCFNFKPLADAQYRTKSQLKKDITYKSKHLSAHSSHVCKRSIALYLVEWFLQRNHSTIDSACLITSITTLYLPLYNTLVIGCGKEAIFLARIVAGVSMYTVGVLDCPKEPFYYRLSMPNNFHNNSIHTLI